MSLIRITKKSGVLRKHLYLRNRCVINYSQPIAGSYILTNLVEIQLNIYEHIHFYLYRCNWNFFLCNLEKNSLANLKKIELKNDINVCVNNLLVSPVLS